MSLGWRCAPCPERASGIDVSGAAAGPGALLWLPESPLSRAEASTRVRPARDIGRASHTEQSKAARSGPKASVAVPAAPPWPPARPDTLSQDASVWRQEGCHQEAQGRQGRRESALGRGQVPPQGDAWHVSTHSGTRPGHPRCPPADASDAGSPPRAAGTLRHSTWEQQKSFARRSEQAIFFACQTLICLFWFFLVKNIKFFI